MAIQQKTSGFRSIRHRIVVFSVLVTLVPSFGMGWYFYTMLYRTTMEKTEQRLMDAAGALEREINLWLKERDRELHVFSNSQVITENLKGDNRASANLRKIINYLTIIKDQFHDYRQLLVFDGQGQVLAVSDLSVEGHPLALPTDWKDRIETSKFFIGEVYSKEDEISPLMLIGIPLLSEKQGDPLGIFAAEIRLAGLLPFLRNALPNGQAKSGKILLIEKNGRRILATSGPGEQKGLAPPAPEEIRLLNTPGHLRKFINNQGKQMVGMGLSFKDVPWDLVIEQSFDEVFAEVIQSRDRIILMAVLFSLIIGLCASILARQILVPLIALTQGVLRVANGELDIFLHIRRNDEFGIVTGMFNTMVKQLKQSHQELEQLATTDTLTKLANRKQIMTSLNRHVEYFRRYSTEFSILMIDIDYFKNINDTHGHLAGDAVLFQMAPDLYQGIAYYGYCRPLRRGRVPDHSRPDRPPASNLDRRTDQAGGGASSLYICRYRPAHDNQHRRNWGHTKR